MVVRENLRRKDGAETPVPEREAVADVNLPLYTVQKCPYLAGRPPCGSHHLFPSGANV